MSEVYACHMQQLKFSFNFLTRVSLCLALTLKNRADIYSREEYTLTHNLRGRTSPQDQQLHKNIHVAYEVYSTLNTIQVDYQ